MIDCFSKLLHYGKWSLSESNNLWREPTLRLSVKRSSPRVKNFSTKIKTLGEEFLRREQKNSRRRILRREQADWLSSKKFFAENFLALSKEILKKSLLHLHIFLSSTCTYTKDIYKFDAILSMFPIFKIFTLATTPPRRRSCSYRLLGA
jgi:hypothetical protein